MKDSNNATYAARSSEATLDLIARDFVSAITQLQSVLPAGTTVDMPGLYRQDPFTLAMLDSLQHAGYGIRWVDDEGSTSLFQYRKVAENAAAEARRDIYELAVGVIEMRRGYAFDRGQRVQPVTPLYVRGADASSVVLDDSIFDQSQPYFQTEVADQAAETAVPVNSLAPMPTTRLQHTSQLTVPADANPLSQIVGEAVSGEPLSLPLTLLPREANVFAIGESNFADALAGRILVTEQILIFENDSLRLGARNKLLVEQMVEQFDPRQDVFSVIGCSMGPTQVNGGNAALALGRAGRVVEALRFASVDDSRILDEGCWAGEGAVENLPGRGVVLTLYRQG